tara:strand:- start:414 stop:617 length:204 start_codon:yes stop_codon:yes gene_type:complete
MAKKQTITKSEFAALTGAKPSRPAKATPQPAAGLDGRVKQLERENAALWVALGEIQRDINRMRPGNG